ncbi:MAG: AAA family ATPase, partial [Proteobacteria bacterium]|nr:AAA family ATPase [Pseudomonadota bacterium]
MNDNIPGISTFSKTISAKVSETIYSQTEVIKLLTAAMVIGGHVLLEGPPGIAKTLLARTFADSLKLNFKRIQFTPDLMPSDITGVSIFDPKS